MAGNNFAVFLVTDSTSIESLARRLAEEGQTTMAFNGTFAMVSDRFGVQWMLGVAAT